jgi:hypothetical protein
LMWGSTRTRAWCVPVASLVHAVREC